MPDPTPAARSLVNSEAAFAKARAVLPGGVNSPVRSFAAVGATPVFVKEADGCILTDVDGNTYIDYVGSRGPIIVGHADERVITALSKAIGRGTSYGLPNEAETQLASMIISALPAVEMIRFTSSGTEAAMSAIRLARAASGSELIVKCIGCYHGHADVVLGESPGVPQSVSSKTIAIPYNDLRAARDVLEKFTQQIACVIVEPVAGNMGVIPPAPDYLRGLRELCDRHPALLIFDEVMSGFRVAWGGAQERYHVRPDITLLGKVIGGGLPIGAYGGSKQLMQMISPAGPVYQAGTLSGNPLSMAGGLATLEILKEPGAYETLEERSEMLAKGLLATAEDNNIPVTINRVGSMLTMFCTAQANQPVTTYADATACDTKRYARFFHAMLQGGVHLPPSQFEAWFVSLAHSEDAITKTVEAADAAFKAMGSSG
jgi:glutamate-1-semialdehyde 2,1-aminomutase